MQTMVTFFGELYGFTSGSFAKSAIAMQDHNSENSQRVERMYPFSKRTWLPEQFVIARCRSAGNWMQCLTPRSQWSIADSVKSNGSTAEKPATANQNEPGSGTIIRKEDRERTTIITVIWR